MDGHSKRGEHPDNQVGIAANAEDAHDKRQRVQAAVLHGVRNQQGKRELDGEDKDPPELHQAGGATGINVNALRHFILLFVLAIPFINNYLLIII